MLAEKEWKNQGQNAGINGAASIGRKTQQSFVNILYVRCLDLSFTSNSFLFWPSSVFSLISSSSHTCNAPHTLIGVFLLFHYFTPNPLDSQPFPIGASPLFRHFCSYFPASHKFSVGAFLPVWTFLPQSACLLKVQRRYQKCIKKSCSSNHSFYMWIK